MFKSILDNVGEISIKNLKKILEVNNTKVFCLGILVGSYGLLYKDEIKSVIYLPVSYLSNKFLKDKGECKCKCDCKCEKSNDTNNLKNEIVE